MTLILITSVCLVRSSDFSRQIAEFHPDRLKAELQTGIVSGCDTAKGGH